MKLGMIHMKLIVKQSIISQIRDEKFHFVVPKMLSIMESIHHTQNVGLLHIKDILYLHNMMNTGVNHFFMISKSVYIDALLQYNAVLNILQWHYYTTSIYY